MALAVAAAVARAEEEPEDENAKPRFDIYGHVMTDVGYNADQIDRDWFDVVRPTKLPSFEDEFAPDGETYFSVRQTRFGVQSWLPTGGGDEVWGIFEFELFGVGDDAGDTTFRLRHAYFQYKKFGAGQYHSPFMDIDVFPNSIEYWGPSGMVFFRNIQLRWMPIQGDSYMSIALERPGASGDPGVIEDFLERRNIRARYQLPDLSAEYRHATDWGYIELAGILRKIEWEDLLADEVLDLSGDTVGWGLNLSSNVRVGNSGTARFQVVYGEAIQNYMNDAAVDIGVEITRNAAGGIRFRGVPLAVLGIVAFYDHNWSDRFSSAIGYSRQDNDNTPLQEDSAFDVGEYALVNLLHHPTDKVMYGAELQWGKRHNFADDFTSDILKLQFSFKYSFSHTIGGNP
jgi:hypothetical protein